MCQGFCDSTCSQGTRIFIVKAIYSMIVLASKESCRLQEQVECGGKDDGNQNGSSSNAENVDTMNLCVFIRFCSIIHAKCDDNLSLMVWF